MRNSTKRKLPNKIRIPVSFTHFYRGVEPSDVDVSSIDETIENALGSLLLLAKDANTEVSLDSVESLDITGTSTEAYCFSDLPDHSSCAVIQSVITVSYHASMTEQEVKNFVFLTLASYPTNFYMLRLRTPNLMIAHVQLWILYTHNSNSSAPGLFYNPTDIYLFESTLQHTLNSLPMYSYIQSNKKGDKTESTRNRNRIPSDKETKINVPFVKLDHYKSVYEEISQLEEVSHLKNLRFKMSSEHQPPIQQNQLIVTNITFMGEFERYSSSSITSTQFEKLVLESVDDESQQIIYTYQSLRGKSNLPQTPIIDIKSYIIPMNQTESKNNIFKFLGFGGVVTVGILLTILILGVVFYVHQQHVQKRRKQEKMNLQAKQRSNRLAHLSSVSNSEFYFQPFFSFRAQRNSNSNEKLNDHIFGSNSEDNMRPHNIRSEKDMITFGKSEKFNAWKSNRRPSFRRGMYTVSSRMNGSLRDILRNSAGNLMRQRKENVEKQRKMRESEELTQEHQHPPRRSSIDSHDSNSSLEDKLPRWVSSRGSSNVSENRNQPPRKSSIDSYDHDSNSSLEDKLPLRMSSRVSNNISENRNNQNIITERNRHIRESNHMPQRRVSEGTRTARRASSEGRGVRSENHNPSRRPSSTGRGVRSESWKTSQRPTFDGRGLMPKDHSASRRPSSESGRIPRRISSRGSNNSSERSYRSSSVENGRAALSGYSLSRRASSEGNRAPSRRYIIPRRASSEGEGITLGHSQRASPASQRLPREVPREGYIPREELKNAKSSWEDHLPRVPSRGKIRRFSFEEERPQPQRLVSSRVGKSDSEYHEIQKRSSNNREDDEYDIISAESGSEDEESDIDMVQQTSKKVVDDENLNRSRRQQLKRRFSFEKLRLKRGRI